MHVIILGEHSTVNGVMHVSEWGAGGNPSGDQSVAGLTTSL